MSTNDTLANALSTLLNAEKSGKKECTISQSSSIIKKVLGMMQDLGYIGEVKEEVTSKGSYLTVALIGNLNECGVIKPRLPVGKDDYDRYEKRYLPARNMGVLVVSTPEGMVTNKDARAKRIGGRLIAYCY